MQGDSNTLLGFKAGVPQLSKIVRSTALGALAMVERSDAIVLGSVAGKNGATRGVFTGIGTTNPQHKLHIVNESAAGILANPNSSLVLESNGLPNYLSILNRNAESGIVFGVGSTPSEAINGGIYYNSAFIDQGMQFRTGGNTPRVVINKEGDVGIGTTLPNYRLDVNGNMRIIGELYQGSVTANLLPICYGSVGTSGNITSGTGNFTVSKFGTGIYDISISGESFSFNNYITSVVPGGTTPRLSVVNATGGVLRVRIFDNTGTALDSAFHFLVYKP
jgi:hypothetical protein